MDILIHASPFSKAKQIRGVLTQIQNFSPSDFFINLKSSTKKVVQIPRQLNLCHHRTKI
jgi:hypothetical protein